MLHLYIFEPHNWSYCGDAIIVIHWSLQQAIELVRAEYPHETDIISDNAKEIEEKGTCGYGWLLTETIQVANERPRVVSFNYQYA